MGQKDDIDSGIGAAFDPFVEPFNVFFRQIPTVVRAKVDQDVLDDVASVIDDLDVVEGALTDVEHIEVDMLDGHRQLRGGMRPSRLARLRRGSGAGTDLATDASAAMAAGEPDASTRAASALSFFFLSGST